MIAIAFSTTTSQKRSHSPLPHHRSDRILHHNITRPLAKVIAGVLWGLNKGDCYPLFITLAYLIG
ncbi:MULTISPECIES: hypothetical protein [Cyanophyceae]|uniref:hypothetical protein n=1 Tax=Cyanophyceae TaxID=3028117 RepID=UPI001684D715|nr:hypothetical protein [Trichocoleus sp. FACHB-69]MBD1930652.1 hypothetical protein [Trichocoleus sp. FACHB-69]